MATDIRQCKMCGKLFHSLGNPLCSECSDEMDRRFIKVRDFIYAHPEATIPEIVEKTEVPEKNILTFLREERLVLAHATGLLNCERCAAPISSGRFCEDCKNQLLRALTPVVVHKAMEQPELEPEKQPQKKESRKNDGQGMIYSRYRRS
ncbi:MAG TPA: MerR family transcriptional regulator [Clostridia bacterium]|nr:MerR family transcriptional regulator [Clostridia bacterium]